MGDECAFPLICILQELIQFVVCLGFFYSSCQFICYIYRELQNVGELFLCQLLTDLLDRSYYLNYTNLKHFL